MDEHQKFLAISRIFNEVVKEELERSFFTNSDASHSNSITITFLDVDADVDVASRDTFYTAPAVIIHSIDCIFCLFLEYPDITHNDRSFFSKMSLLNEEIYRENSVSMIKEKDFQSCIFHIFENLASERLEEVQQLIVS